MVGGYDGGVAEAAKRDAYHHGDLRQALIDAAITLLEEGGVQNLSLRKAAKLAGVSPGAPYHHFANRGALMAAIAHEGFVRLGAAMEDADGPDAVSRLQRCGEAYVRFALANPAHFRVMFRPELAAHDEFPELKEVADAAFQGLVDRVLEAQGSREIPEGEHERFVMLAWSMAHGLASLLVDGPIGKEEFDGKISVPKEQLVSLVVGTFSQLLRDAARLR